MSYLVFAIATVILVQIATVITLESRIKSLEDRMRITLAQTTEHFELVMRCIKGTQHAIDAIVKELTPYDTGSRD